PLPVTTDLIKRVLAIGLSVGIALPAAARDTAATVNTDKAHWTLQAENGNTTTFTYGRPGDVPFMGDWDGDGVDTPGLYRQSDGRMWSSMSRVRWLSRCWLHSMGTVATRRRCTGRRRGSCTSRTC